LSWRFPEYPSNWDDLRREVLELDGYRCQNCGRSTKRLHIHHIVPLSAGGSNDISNLVCLCEECHSVEHPHLSETGYRLGDRLHSYYLYCENCKRNFLMESNLLFCPECESFLKTGRYLEPKRGPYDYQYLKYGVSEDQENRYNWEDDDLEPI